LLELNKLYCIDVFEGLKLLENNSIDLIVTSPPYNNWRNKRTQKQREEFWQRTNIKYDSFNDKMTDEEYINWQIKIINECIRVLKPTGTFCYNHKDRIYNYEVFSPLVWILKTNAILRQKIIWDRGGMQAFNPVRFYRVEEEIYILGKKAKGFYWNNECAKYLSIWRINPTKKNDGHPCSFPEEIPKRCIESFTQEGMVVLDPFVGIGTTAKIAKRMNRKYIGFDNSQKYIDLAIINLQ